MCPAQQPESSCHFIRADTAVTAGAKQEIILEVGQMAGGTADINREDNIMKKNKKKKEQES